MIIVVDFIFSYAWFLLPLYLTNMLLFVGVQLVKKLRVNVLLKPIDFGLRFVDGRRIIGNHKPVAGWLVPLGVAVVLNIFTEGFVSLLVVCYGAFLGDLSGSFFKRRLGLNMHEFSFGIDQLGYVLGALLGVHLLISSINVWDGILLVLVSVFVHILGNIVIFVLKLSNHDI